MNRGLLIGTLILFHVLMISISQLPVDNNTSDSFCGTSFKADSSKKSSNVNPTLLEQEYLLIKASLAHIVLLSPEKIVEQTQKEIDLLFYDITTVYFKSEYSLYNKHRERTLLPPDLAVNPIPS